MPQASEPPLSELIVLGLLAERPRHGYEIGQAIEQRRLRTWTRLGRSLVYDVLKRLQRRKWVTTVQVPGERGPGAQQCTLSSQGRTILEDTVQQAIADALLDPSRTELALMFSWVLDVDVLRTALDARIKRAQERLTQTRYARQHMGPQDPKALPIQTAVFDHFEVMVEADLAWAQAFVKRFPPAPQT